MSVLKFMGSATQLFTWVGKIFQIYESYNDTCEAYKDPEISTQKKCIRISANVLFTAAQVAEISAHNHEGGLKFNGMEISDSNLRLGTKVVAGLTDVTREVAKSDRLDKETALNVATTLAFRASDVAHGVLHEYPHVICEYHDSLEGFAMISSSVHQTLIMRNKIRRAISIGGRAGIRLVNYLRQKYGIEQSLEDWKEIYKEEMRKIPKGEFIPDYLEGEIEFTEFTCPIRRKPIRHVYTFREIEGGDNESDDEDEIVYYEKAAILSWIRAQANVQDKELPPKWDARLPLVESSVISCKHIQKLVNKRLNLYQSELSEYGVVEDYTRLLQTGKVNNKKLEIQRSLT